MITFSCIHPTGHLTSLPHIFETADIYSVISHHTEQWLDNAADDSYRQILGQEQIEGDALQCGERKNKECEEVHFIISFIPAYKKINK
ncbi:hypothetical protein CDAR_367341 [Caerostris darwini]|uniref:Uncharacterized protein n=1 Tax=Caerostris darwini TaxID=1538125 RepID=A0AAV4WHA4_9ARAC|nr:hypothetical protein CDAR_367341 [Caerostris darwini]